MKGLLIVGHQPWAKGASNPDATNEFDFNSEIAGKVSPLVKRVEIIVEFYQASGGNVARWDAMNADFVIELHANAFNHKASGTTVLYAQGSTKGAMIAQTMLDHIVGALNLMDRKILPRTRKDRGGYLLWGTSAPCIIPEPFFIDNDEDLMVARNANLHEVYAAAIDDIAGNLAS